MHLCELHCFFKIILWVKRTIKPIREWDKNSYITSIIIFIFCLIVGILLFINGFYYSSLDAQVLIVDGEFMGASWMRDYASLSFIPAAIIKSLIVIGGIFVYIRSRKGYKKVLFICPVCKAKKALGVPKSVIDKAKQITTMSIARSLVCQHQFQAFIDKFFKVRGY